MDLQDNEIPPLRKVADWSSDSTPADTGGMTRADEIATYESIYPYAPLLVSPPAFWRALRVLHYRHDPADLAFPALPDIEITVHLQGRAHVARSAGGPWERKLVDHGQIGIAPAGQADRWSWEPCCPFATTRHRCGRAGAASCAAAPPPAPASSSAGISRRAAWGAPAPPTPRPTRSRAMSASRPTT